MTPSAGNTLIVFGSSLLFGVLGGMLANRIKWMPTITAFMILGFIIGPHVLGLITHPMLTDASVLINIALGLILTKLGNMLHPKAMFGSRRLMMMSLAETLLTFLLVFICIYTLCYGALMASLIGAIAVSSSPAVLVQLSDELGTKGTVTDRTKSLVALNNLASFFLFSLSLPFAIADQSSVFEDIAFPLYRLLGAFAIGTLVAWLSIRIVKMLSPKGQHYRFTIVVGGVMLTLGLADLLQTSTLLAPLILGVATRWFESSKHNLSKIELGEGGDLFIILLFVLAGAKINPHYILEAGLAALLLAFVRSAGKLAGIYLVGRKTGFSKTQSMATTLLLLPMAGMAIGLVGTCTNLVPEMGEKITTIVFGMIVLFETIGPFAATKAFYLAGEVPEPEKVPEPTTP
ncbi:MAG: peptidase [Proteobacteria bacterium]|jgi:Kef-type K+ transport system membrane component KefB|nr:cation:proton antiporter [Alphaproteobacteria bacterium]NCC03990.1 peptidase [Pseudomonadota bacterium]